MNNIIINHRVKSIFFLLLIIESLQESLRSCQTECNLEVFSPVKSGSAEKLDYKLVIIKMNNFTNDIVASKINEDDLLIKNREKVSNSVKSRRLVSD